MKSFFLFGLLSIGWQLSAQEVFTRKDSLHGGMRQERSCFDVQRYDLNIKVNIDEKSIKGSNTISFKIVDSTKTIQLDLFENMQIDSIVHRNTKLMYRRECNAVFIDFSEMLTPEMSEQSVEVFYSGNPIIAKRAPWDGGFVFSKDEQGKPWVGIAVQGTGASL
ncbi:MAG TPA: M1 family peptidase, partial [Flavobacterium sp.]|nr:M1 family peptidase [Flavobacterium sp.]